MPNQNTFMPACDILIIDNAEDDTERFSEVFTNCGIRNVKYVYSAMDAFKYLHRIESPDELPKLIVTELYLPDISGIEFSDNLKTISKFSEIPVIVLYTVRRDESKKRIKDYIICS